MERTITEAVSKIQEAKSITFLTGAGVSTPSGIPDYRSLQGVYHGIERPEYLLSTDCLEHEPEKFYEFVKHLYHPQAKPNIIHKKMADLEKTKRVWVVSQNIDGLHQKAGSKHLVNFHGSLYHCYCRKCGQSIPWQDYLEDWHHQGGCGGQVRPAVVLYGEGFTQETLQQAVEAVAQARLIVVVGTSLNVYPFAGLVDYRKNASVLVINKTALSLPAGFEFVQTSGEEIFSRI